MRLSQRLPGMHHLLIDRPNRRFLFTGSNVLSVDRLHPVCQLAPRLSAGDPGHIENVTGHLLQGFSELQVIVPETVEVKVVEHLPDPVAVSVSQEVSLFDVPPVGYQKESVDAHPFLSIEMDIVNFSIDDMYGGLIQEGHLLPRGKTHPYLVDLLTGSLNRRNGNRIFESRSTVYPGEHLFIE